MHVCFFIKITIANLLLLFPVVDCAVPEKLEHGQITLASNATYYGAIALYACDNHFQLDGVSRRLCQENGTWSSERPICKGKLANIKIFNNINLNILKAVYYDDK